MSNVIHERSSGPEIIGTRLTVYNLLQSFLDPTITEYEIGRIYELTAQQVAAARAYVLRNPDTVLAQHLNIEERMQAGNPPEVLEQAERAKTIFNRFKQWLEQRNVLEQSGEITQSNQERLPTFRAWLAEQEQR